MKSILSTFITLLLCSPLLCQSTDLGSQIIMTVNKRPVEAGEFMRMYKKSNEPGKNITVDDYLPQFVLFKQKVADAVSEGYDTTAAFRNELAGYRSQLAENYLTDDQTREKFLRKAYNRYLTDLNVWHILVAVSPDASSEDTLKALKKTREIRERILRGESFAEVARSSSDDPSARINGGNLGYITVFQTIMPFEDAAYSLKKGALSAPVRTPFGYHLVKVTEIRPSRGRILVAHIMKNVPPEATEAEVIKADTGICRIYDDLNRGEPFSELAQKYSDDKESSSRGGTLNWFGTGEMMPQFADAAFSIADTGQYTKPFRTIYGFHIVKLLARRAPGSFDETKSYLESRLNESYLNTLCKNAFVEKLKKEYKFKTDKTSFDWFVNNTDTLITAGPGKYNCDSVPEGKIFTFSGGRLSNREFAEFINKSGPLFATRDPVLFLRKALETVAAEMLISYEDTKLGDKYPEFRYLMDEFHDGILLFDISGKKVWDRAVADSAGLHIYYERNKHNYLSIKKMEGRLYTFRVKDGADKLKSAYGRYAGKPDGDERLREKLNGKHDTLLFISDGMWQKGEDPEIDAADWTAGSHYFTHNGFPSVICVKTVTEPLPLKFEDIKDQLMNSYQDYLYNEWTGQLKQKYAVWVDSKVLDAVKKKVADE